MPMRWPRCAFRARRVAQEIDDFAAHAAKYGAKGLAYAKIDAAGTVSSPVAKFFAEDAFAGLLKHVGAGNGDIVFFGAGPYNKVSDFMGAVRLKAGKDFHLVQDVWAPLWVTDFPMFEWDRGAADVALPIRSPRGVDDEPTCLHGQNAVSRGYDMVLNGNESAGGSIRTTGQSSRRVRVGASGGGAAAVRLLLDAQYGAPARGIALASTACRADGRPTPLDGSRSQDHHRAMPDTAPPAGAGQQLATSMCRCGTRRAGDSREGVSPSLGGTR